MVVEGFRDEPKPDSPAGIAAATLAANRDTLDMLRGAAEVIAEGLAAPVSDQVLALGRLAVAEAVFADGTADQHLITII